MDEAKAHSSLEDLFHFVAEAFEAIDLPLRKQPSDEVSSAKDDQEENEGLEVAKESSVCLEVVVRVGSVGFWVGVKSRKEGKIEVFHDRYYLHVEIWQRNGDDIDVHVDKLQEIKQNDHRVI